MKAPRFWSRPPRLSAAALAPVGAAVGAITMRRLVRPPGVRLPVPVVCVGNPTVGGTGKTPVAIAVAAHLAEAGATPVFLTRGYGGRLKGPVAVRGHTSAQVGDEACLLAAHHPTIVSADRGSGGRLAARHGNVVVMDDGFQNPGLYKDVSLLLIDADAGVGNGKIVPAGPLRAPLGPQLAFADAVVFVNGPPPTAVVQAVRQANVQSFGAHLALIGPPPTPDQPLLAFAGIGRPEKFFHALRDAGHRLAAVRAFADHHPYRPADATRLLTEAKAMNARPATTAKDHVRLKDGGPEARALAERALVFDVRAELDEPLLTALLSDIRRNHPAWPSAVRN